MKKQMNFRFYLSFLIIFLFLIHVNNTSSILLNEKMSDEELNIPHSGIEVTGNVVLMNFTGCYQIEILDIPTNVSKWFIHIPIVNAHQCPVLLLNVWSTPNEIIKDYRINTEDFSGDNYLLEVNFIDIPESGIYKIYWKISTFVRYNHEEALPSSIVKASVDELPDEVIPWLESSEYIQSNASEIQEKALELTINETDAIEITRKIINYTTNGIDYSIDINNYSQDALNSLRRETAVCTGRANLAAAMMRASGIPARILMIYPTHFITECYLHPYGWVRVEPGMAKFVSETFQLTNSIFTCFLSYVTAYCASIEDETPNSQIEGFAPDSGVIAYWAPTDTSVGFMIDVSNDWDLSSKAINGPIGTVDEAFNITDQVWQAILLHNKASNSTELNTRFENAQSLQLKALWHLGAARWAEYIDLMTQALDEYNDVESNSIIGYDLSFALLIGSFAIAIIITYLKKKL